MPITDSEYQILVNKCKKLPPTVGKTVIYDYVENLLYTVLDFNRRGVVVEKAVNHYRSNVREQDGIKDHESLKHFLARYPNDREGNRQAAQYLWGNNFWGRIELLRRFMQYFEDQGVTNQVQLEKWTKNANFNRDFKGRVFGADIAIFKWLTMRVGVETIKPDIWIHSFIKETIGRNLSNEEAIEVLENIASEIGMKSSKLDLAIWEYMRG